MKVKEYKIGGTTVEIYDDYIVKTEEERQAILDRVGKIYSDYFSTASMKAKETSQTA